jgi:nucleotide-binding universal stress UspA family protein
MHVLLAIDGSSQSLAAARYLARLPFPEKPQCTVVTALLDTQTDLVNTDEGLEVRGIDDQDVKQAYDNVREVLSPVCTQVQHVVKRQHPSQLILDVGKELNVDLIVVGSVGHSALYRMTIGSTADYVAHHARCSTLVARTGNDATTGSEVAGEFKVVFAHDGSASADLACEQLRSFQWPETTHVRVVRLLAKPKLVSEDEAYDPEGIRKHQAELSQLRGGVGCKFDVLVSESVDIPSGLYATIKEQQADLLFVGDTGRSAFARFFLGSTSRYLLHHVDCAMWIARPKKWK